MMVLEYPGLKTNILDDDGNPHTVHGVMLDVTERKRVEEILQSTEYAGVGLDEIAAAAQRLYCDVRYAGCRHAKATAT